jgi:predicted Zn-dependent protease
MSTVIPIKGDPMVFLKNTVGDPSSGIPTSLLTDGSEWQLITAGYYTEEQIEIKSQKDAEEQNKPTGDGEGKNREDRLRTFTLKKTDSTDQIYKMIPLKNSSMQLSFKKTDEKMKLISMSSEGFDADNFNVHHYSVKKDGNSFSILTSFSFSKYKYLLSFIFNKKEDTTLFERTLDKAYRYLNGPGVASRWNQKKPVQVNICEHEISLYNKLNQESVERWKTHLKDRLEVITKTTKSCPPFSDLNTVTIAHITDWIEVLGPGSHNAQTMTVHDYYNYEIIDSDIFFLESEWDEAYQRHHLTLKDKKLYESEYFQREYKRTQTHEFGHSLGLDHKFDGTPSIMSYDDTDTIQTYDIEAIQALYPTIEEDDVEDKKEE